MVSRAGYRGVVGVAEWVVYVLVSEVTSVTYVGITTDMERRLDQHNGLLPGGAKRTRADRPWRVGKCYGPYQRRGDALRAELAVKKLRGARRLDWE